MHVLKTVGVAMLLAPLAPLYGADTIPVNHDLVVHEWGTFTSVAGANGDPVEWASVAGASDLPCFVERLRPQSTKLAPALVRMETPVLYFYPRSRIKVSVNVKFPQGWITEWYPRATRVLPDSQQISGISHGQIDWDSVELSPGETSELPTTTGASRYYAARNTDSATLRAGGQNEKMIFYRGVGNFEVPLHPKFTRSGNVEIRNAGANAIPVAILFENRDDVAGYRVVRDLRGVTAVDAPELAENPDSVRPELAAALVDSGLYWPEALAMIETWHDSWFEEGTRLIYIVPRSQVDLLLPLTVEPNPVSIARVFVGRVEILSPAERQAAESALVNGDPRPLVKFGRFLNAFVNQMNRSLLDSSAGQRSLQQAYTAIQREQNGEACVR